MRSRLYPNRLSRWLLAGRASVLGPALVLAALGCREGAEPPTAPQSAAPTPTPAIAAAALAFRQVSAGLRHTCGVTTDDRAYCWGSNVDEVGGGEGGQLGDGTTTNRLRPVLVAGGLRFRQVSAGVSHTCGITTDDRAYCWGSNGAGQLGDGTTGTRRLTPVAVAGGRFSWVSAGYHHTCAVNPSDVAFCWGTGPQGGAVLGTGGRVTNSATPVRVAGGLRWRRVHAGFSHTCGATTDDRGYCWGEGINRQIGDGSNTTRAKPTLVAGGLRFRDVRPGHGFIEHSGEPVPDLGYSCGVTTGDLAYCWGTPGLSLGRDDPPRSATPVEVVGRQFRSVTPGALHTCGVNPFDAAFCWGYNDSGQLGTGGGNSTTPVRVAGGLRFSGVSASGVGIHTCGVTTGNRAYCWGNNVRGQLGDGTTTARTTPVAVAGAM
jgi:Regulator of Chromosome Condensation (RCC1) repeat protein